MMNKIFSLLGLSVIFCGLALFSCKTFSVDDYTKLGENDFFNRTQLKQQAALTNKDYQNVIELYTTYIELFEENTQRPDRIMESRYELGYIHHYLKDFDEAEKRFRSIVHDYDEGDAKYAPQWIYVLSKQLKEDIQRIRTERVLEETKKLEKQKELKNKLTK